MKGRPPKPAMAKILDGTWRDDRHGDPSTIVIADGEPTMPPKLRPGARELWEAVVPGLVQSGVARARDTCQLVAMCEWWGRYRTYAERLDAAGPKTRNIRQLFYLAERAYANFDRAATKFGLAPVDRARIRSELPAKKTVASRERNA